MFQPERLGGVAVASIALALGCAEVRAQQTITTATITGRICDAAGAAIPRAAVAAVSLGTGQRSEFTADEKGRFRISFLPAGGYRVSGASAGFAEAVRTVSITAGSSYDLTLTLSVHPDEAFVSVASDSAFLGESRSEVAATVRPDEILQLPFAGRNYLDLALLAPGVSSTNTNSVQTFAETAPIIGQGYSVNSQRNFSNSFVVDGLSANDDAAGLAGNFYGMDVVEEFQVVTSGGQAEFGRAMGGYFNIVTRSGTNTPHGTLYGFLRNQRLNARNALSRGKLPLTQGQFGGSLSGPIQTNKTFAFGNYEGRRLNTNGIVTIAPANAAAINARLDTIGFSGPRLAVGTGSTTLFPTTVHTDTAFLRADHQFRPQDQFSLRYSFYRLNATNARGVGSLADVSYGTAVRDINHTVALSNVATISPHLVNETRAQFTYDSLDAPSNTQNSPAIVISGVATFGRFSSSPTARLNDLAEVVDNVLLQRSSHSIKMGVDFLENVDTITNPGSIRGSYTFASLAAFSAGTYNTGGYTQSFGNPTVRQTNPNVGLYVQDEWQAAPALTINAGLRYDLQFLQSITTDKNNISPRFGFAWSPATNRRTTLRGSFGLYYDRVPLRALANALLSAGNTTDRTRGNLLSYTYSPSTVNAPVFPSVASTPPPGALVNYTLMNPNIQNAYAQQLSLQLSQGIGQRTFFELSYQRSRGLHLLSSYNTNINPDGSRPDPTRGNIKPYDSRFDSNYDGLAVSVVQRPAPWGSARLSYTWSKAINNVGEFFFSSPINNFDFQVDRVRSDDDQRHRLVLDAVLTSPRSRASGLLPVVTHGWSLSGILQYSSRLPFNITTGGTTLQQTTARPCAPGFYGTAACAAALRGAVIGRNTGVGFDFFALNTRLSRSFPLTERLRLETMIEAFNALNHRNDAIPNGTFGTGRITSPATNANFGQATAVNDPRSLQVAARLQF